MKNRDQFAIFENLKGPICKIWKWLETYLQFFWNFGGESEFFIKYEDHLTKFKKLIINNLTFTLYSVKKQFEILYFLVSF